MITVTLGEVKPQEKGFPKLMKGSDGNIFYMVRERYGLPLTDADETIWRFANSDFADFSKNYRTFTDYDLPITIQNS
jgi:hypothetical protein